VASAALSTTDVNGWRFSATGADNAIDNLNAGYCVPHDKLSP